MSTAAEYFEQLKARQSKALEILGHPNHASNTVGTGALIVLTRELPGIPTIGELIELNQKIHDDAGTPEHHRLDQPAALEDYLGLAHANYTGTTESIISTAAVLVYGIAAAQAFFDGNRRTAYFATQSFLYANDHSFLTSQATSDHLLARKLNQVVEPRQKKVGPEDFVQLFTRRAEQRKHPAGS